MNKEHNKPVFLLITEALRKDILFGNLDPGMVLNEVELARRFNTSRAPVRESIRLLEGEGLIVRNVPVGYKIRDFRLEEFIERNILLKILEKEMLTRAIPRYTELEFCQMEKLVDTIAGSKNLEELISHLIEFNVYVLRPTGWDFSIQLVRQILFRTVPYYREIARKYMHHGMTLESHRAFISLCREGRMQEAIDRWTVRYDRSGQEVFAKFAQTGEGQAPFQL